MCSCSPAPHIVRGQNTLQMHGFPIRTGLTFFTRSEERKYKATYFDVYYTRIYILMNIGAWPVAIYGWEGLGDWGMGCQWLAGLVSRVCLLKGGNMIGSSYNSGGIVAGALVCGIECSGFKSCFML